MATYDRWDEGYSRNKLEDFTSRLEKAQKDVLRLTAAIRFLEANPDAVALINSL